MRHAAGPRLPRPRPAKLVAVAARVSVALCWLVFLHPQELGGSAKYVVVSGTSMEPTMHTGDLLVARRQDSYEVGDVAVYRVPIVEVGGGQQVVHRIVGGSPEEGYLLQGDNRDLPDQWRPTAAELVGDQMLHVPHGGKLLAILRSPLMVATVITCFAVLGMTGRGSTPSAPARVTVTTARHRRHVPRARTRIRTGAVGRGRHRPVTAGRSSPRRTAVRTA